MEIQQPTLEALKLLVEVSQLLTLRDLDRVLQQVIELARQAVGAKKVSLFLHEDGEIDWGHIFIVRDLTPDESVKVVRRVLDKGFAGWVYRHQQGDIIYDTETDDRWLIFPDDPIVVRSAMCVPFMFNEQVIAVLTLTHPEPHHFSDYHLRLITIVANQFTIAIRNAQFFHRIQTQQRQLQTILQSISDALLVLDGSGHILMLNEAAVPLVDVEMQGDALERRLHEFVQRDRIFEPMIERVENPGDQDNWTFEVRSDRLKKDFQVVMSTWKDILEGVVGYVIVLHDVTTLRDLNRFKDDMLRVASHDLRSPLALISGYIHMIEMDTPDPHSPIQEYINVIKNTTDRMGSLLDDLLRIERIRSSPLELQEQTDVAQLVKIAIVNMRPLATAKNQQFESSIALDGAPRIQADSVLIRQAMENLIGNAIKYTPADGQIRVIAASNHTHFHFSVLDNGPGIAAEHLAHLFEPFFRAPQIVSNEKGTGLGLSLVKNVIERHQGEVWVKSVVGQGSEFGFWLPLV